jgi:Ca2+/Na+ antiporter
MMRQVATQNDRLFRVSFRTVECFAVVMVAAFLVLGFTGSACGDKFHYHYLFDVSVPVMIVVAVCAYLTWKRYRRDSLIIIGAVIAWAVWAALPRL